MADVRGPVRLLAGSAVAVLTHQPWLFPSLGPAVMPHVEKPQAPESSPRNTLIGHVAVDCADNRATGQDMPVWCAPAPHTEEARHG